MFFQKKQKKNYVKIYESSETGERFALMAINGEMKENLISRFKETYMIRGNHINKGGKASDLCIPTLLVGGAGALKITAATSGTLFMATANPATLMVLGNGVGSAVMGAGGIVAQAPFIPVAGALMPVVAPLLAFQALSTAMVIQRFKSVNEKLDNLSKAINRNIQRNEAMFIGELFSADSRLDTLEHELTVTNRFTSDMMLRLSLIENSINPIFERYQYLYGAQIWNKDLRSEDLAFNQTDAFMVAVLSMIDLRIDVLRLRLTIQENPGYLKDLANKVVEKIDRYQELWKNIANGPLKVEEIYKSIDTAIDTMSWWQRNMPAWFLGDRNSRIKMQQQSAGLNNQNSISQIGDLLDATKSAQESGTLLSERIESALSDNMEPISLIYWEDETGKHSYYTNDIVIS